MSLNPMIFPPYTVQFSCPTNGRFRFAEAETHLKVGDHWTSRTEVWRLCLRRTEFKIGDKHKWNSVSKGQPVLFRDSAVNIEIYCRHYILLLSVLQLSCDVSSEHARNLQATDFSYFLTDVLLTLNFLWCVCRGECVRHSQRRYILKRTANIHAVKIPSIF